MVGGESLADSVTLHEYEAHRIAQRPVLIGSSPEEFQGGKVEIRIHENDPNGKIVFEVRDEFQNGPTRKLAHLGKRNEFGEHVIVSDTDRGFGEMPHSLRMV